MTSTFTINFQTKAQRQKQGRAFNPLTDAGEIFAGSQRTMDVNKHLMAAQVAGKKPHKRIHVGAAGPGSKGMIIGTAIQKKGSPQHKGMMDNHGAPTFWEIVEQILRGALRAGELVVLVIQGLGEVTFEVTNAMIQAVRDMSTRAGNAIRGTSNDLDRWLFDHGAVIMMGGWGMVILGAIILL